MNFVFVTLPSFAVLWAIAQGCRFFSIPTISTPYLPPLPWDSALFVIYICCLSIHLLLMYIVILNEGFLGDIVGVLFLSLVFSIFPPLGIWVSISHLTRQ